MIPSRSETDQELIRVAAEFKDKELDDIRDQIKNNIRQAIHTWRENTCTVNIKHMHKVNVDILLKELTDLRYEHEICGSWLKIKWSRLNYIFGQE